MQRTMQQILLQRWMQYRLQRQQGQRQVMMVTVSQQSSGGAAIQTKMMMTNAAHSVLVLAQPEKLCFASSLVASGFESIAFAGWDAMTCVFTLFSL